MIEQLPLDDSPYSDCQEIASFFDKAIMEVPRLVEQSRFYLTQPNGMEMLLGRMELAFQQTFDIPTATVNTEWAERAYAQLRVESFRHYVVARLGVGG